MALVNSIDLLCASTDLPTEVIDMIQFKILFIDLLKIWRYDVNLLLLEACVTRELNIVEEISLHDNNYNWKCGFFTACRHGRLNVVEFLISKGANWWKDGYIGACYGGHLIIIELIISKGVNNWTGHGQSDPLDWNCGLYYACNNDHTNVIDFLIGKGANYCKNCNNKKHNIIN